MFWCYIFCYWFGVASSTGTSEGFSASGDDSDSFSGSGDGTDRGKLSSESHGSDGTGITVYASRELSSATDETDEIDRFELTSDDAT